MAKDKNTKSFEEEKADYEKEVKHNEEQFKFLLKRVRPDLFVLIELLEITKINPLILYKVLRQISNVAIGTGYGEIVVKMENGVVTFIYGQDSDKVNEPAIKK